LKCCGSFGLSYCVTNISTEFGGYPLEIFDFFFACSNKKSKSTFDVKKTFTGQDEQYELTKELISKIGVEKRNTQSKPHEDKKEVFFSTQQLKDISALLYEASEAAERGDFNSLVQNIDKLLNPILHGTLILDNFFEDHRELRLFNSRLRERGQEYLNLNKEEISKFMLDLDKKLRG